MNGGSRSTATLNPLQTLTMWNTVCVISQNGQALMPTHAAKTRVLLKTGKAVATQRKLLTIQLTYDTVTTYTQPITLGIDSGYLHIGSSAVTQTKEPISGEVHLLPQMKERLIARVMHCTQRRSGLRYRSPPFNKRVSSKKLGWLAPSIQQKLDSHHRFIDKMKRILPISKIIVEVANFDIQKIKNLLIEEKNTHRVND